MVVNIVLRDAVGSEFSTTDTLEAIYEVDVKNVVSIRMDTARAIINVTGLMEGVAVLHVFSPKMPQLQDYLKVRVSSLIQPQRPSVHLGGTVSFRVPLAPSVAVPSLWTSDNPAVLRFVVPSLVEPRAHTVKQS
jgi:hypothetical protein